MVMFSIYCILKTLQCNFQVVYLFHLLQFFILMKINSLRNVLHLFLLLFAEVSNDITPNESNERQVAIGSFCWQFIIPSWKRFCRIITVGKNLSPHTRSLINQMMLDLVSSLTIPSFVGQRYFYLDDDFPQIYQDLKIQ